MKVYLSQHGQQVSKDMDPDEPLSDKGRAEVASIAEQLSSSLFDIAKIEHSVKLRAKQTAQLFSELIPPDVELVEREGLKAKDYVQPIADELNAADNDIMLVGHMPFMEKIVGTLLVNDPDTRLVNFERGCLLCLERNDNHWSVSWLLRPSLFST